MDNPERQKRSENMRRIRSKGTSPEWIVRRMLHSMGFRYRLHVPSLPGKPDIVLPRHGAIIEVYGCFWHQHAGCPDSHYPKSRQDYWVPKLDRNRRRDSLNRSALKRLGWRLLVIWECQTTNPVSLRRRITSFLSS